MKFQLLIIALFLSNLLLAQGKKPNILIILADDLGYHDVSYYGTPDIRTPNIDKLCKSGLRFDYFCSNSSVCSPTRASLMSGCYPERVGVPGVIRSKIDDNFGFLKPDVQLLPALLKKANYKTALVGKWHLGIESPNLPNEKGFDVFHGFLDDMMDDYYTHLRHGENFMRENKTVVSPKGHATDIFTDWATDFIGTQKTQKNPFFLYLAYNAPHAPIQPTTEWLQKVRNREPNITDKRAKLVALIEHMDDGIGKVISALKKSGKYENTLIIFISDNGGKLEDGANNGQIRNGKGSMYEGGVRVPAIFAWHNQITEGGYSDQRAMTMDIFPTINEIIGGKTPIKVDGISLLKVLKNPNEKLPERLLFFIRREGNMEYGGQTIQSLISDNWKLLQNSPFQPYELYNLINDPFEQHNLAKTETEKYKKLFMMMINHIKKGGSVPWQKPTSRIQ